jgi:hypothetical protein
MSRKTVLLALSLFLAVVGGGGAALVLLVRHEPAVYRHAAVPPGPGRVRQSQEFLEEFSQLISAVTPGNERGWDVRLTAEQINSYFAEGFKQSKLDERLLPEGISEPRVLLDPGKLSLAFRYGSGLWSTVISIEFGLWLTEEPNVVAMRLQGLRAGSLPINAQYLLDSLTELAENNGIQVNWYRWNGDPVALLRFQGEQREATVQLEFIQVDQDSLMISGRPVDAQFRAAVVETLKPRTN